MFLIFGKYFEALKTLGNIRLDSEFCTAFQCVPHREQLVSPSPRTREKPLRETVLFFEWAAVQRHERLKKCRQTVARSGFPLVRGVGETNCSHGKCVRNRFTTFKKLLQYLFTSFNDFHYNTTRNGGKQVAWNDNISQNTNSMTTLIRNLT